MNKVEQATRNVITTSWFRTPAVWSILDREILPALARPRIWAGACGSGEEAYTAEIVAYPHAGTVHATDINPTMIDRSRTGTYDLTAVLTESMGQMTSQRLTESFTLDPSSNTAALQSHIRRTVTFGILDLNTDSAPPCDLAVLANVWRHLEDPARNRLLHNLHDVIPPAGRLVLGGADFYPTLEHARSQTEWDGMPVLRELFAEAEHELIWRPL